MEVKGRHLRLVGLLIVLLVLAAWWVWPRDDTVRRAASPDPQVRARVAGELADKPGPSHKALLQQLARDGDAQVATAAVLGLRPTNQAQDNSAIQSLLRELLASGAKDPLVRATAAAQLGLFADTDPQWLSTRLLDQGEPPAVRAGAALGLGRLKEPEAVPALYRALRDGAPEVRARAVAALSAICLTHFLYDASKPPQEQEENIRFIGEHLRKCKLLGATETGG